MKIYTMILYVICILFTGIGTTALEASAQNAKPTLTTQATQPPLMRGQSLRSMRSQATITKPGTVNLQSKETIEQSTKAAIEIPNKLFSEEELKKMSVTLTKEEAAYLKKDAKTSVFEIIGTIALQSTPNNAGKTSIDISLFDKLGYHISSKEYARGDQVAVKNGLTFYRGIVLGKENNTYIVQVTQTDKAPFDADDIFKKK